MRHSGTGQGQGNEQCFNSVFHTVFSLFVNSGITLTAVKTVNKWQCSEMEKAAKATFSCYSCNAFFCEAASGLLLFQRIANFDRSEEHTSELQSRFDLVCRLLLEKKK